MLGRVLNPRLFTFTVETSGSSGCPIVAWLRESLNSALSDHLAKHELSTAALGSNADQWHPNRHLPLARLVESMICVDRDQKLVAGLLLIFAGVIWLFFVIIWLPPFTIVVMLIGHTIGFPNSFYGRWLWWLDVTMALCAMGYGVYLILGRRHAVSKSTRI